MGLLINGLLYSKHHTDTISMKKVFEYEFILFLEKLIVMQIIIKFSKCYKIEIYEVLWTHKRGSFHLFRVDPIQAEPDKMSR